MRSKLFLWLSATAVSISCNPPIPFVPYSQAEPGAAASLAREEKRVLPLQPSDAFSRVTTALLSMHCRITASDSQNGVLSFEKKDEYRYLGSVYYSVLEGTLHITNDGPTVNSYMVLNGKLIDFPGSRPPLGTNLSGEDYKKFYNDLLHALKQ